MGKYCLSQSNVNKSVPKLDFFVLNPQYYVNSKIPYKDNALNIGIGGAVNVALGKSYFSVGVSYLQRDYYESWWGSNTIDIKQLNKFKTIFVPYEFHFPLQKRKSNNYVNIGYCSSKVLSWNIYKLESDRKVLYDINKHGLSDHGRWIIGGVESMKMLNKNSKIKLKFGGMFNLSPDITSYRSRTFSFIGPIITFVQVGVFLDLEK